jgi:hypothetical protein
MGHDHEDDDENANTITTITSGCHGWVYIMSKSTWIGFHFPYLFSSMIQWMQ